MQFLSAYFSYNDMVSKNHILLFYPRFNTETYSAPPQELATADAAPLPGESAVGARV